MKTCFMFSGDKQFLEILEQEIDAEKKRAKEVPNVSQFEVSSQGPEVILSREMDGETYGIFKNHILMQIGRASCRERV